METLVAAIIGLIFIVVAFVSLGVANKFIENNTGRRLEEWFRDLFVAGLFSLVGVGGVALVRWGTNAESVSGTMFGIVVVLIGFGMAIYTVFQGVR